MFMLIRIIRHALIRNSVQYNILFYTDFSSAKLLLSKTFVFHHKVVRFFVMPETILKGLHFQMWKASYFNKENSCSSGKLNPIRRKVMRLGKDRHY